MTSRRAALALVVLAGATLSGCAMPNSLTATPPDGVPAPTATATVGEPEGGNFLVLRTAERELRLETMEEAENFDPAPAGLPVVASDEVFVFVRPARWPLFVEQLADVPGGCGPRSFEPTVSELGGGWWSVTPVNDPGTYTMRLSAGSGPGLPLGGEVGSMAAYVEWHTTTGTPIPARAWIDVSIFPGEPGSVVVAVENMGGVPEAVEATATLSGEDGTPVTVELTGPDDDNCVQPGDLYLMGELTESENRSLEAFPYEYDVTLTLDGTEHRATGDVGEANQAALRFTPALP